MISKLNYQLDGEEYFSIVANFYTVVHFIGMLMEAEEKQLVVIWHLLMIMDIYDEHTVERGYSTLAETHRQLKLVNYSEERIQRQQQFYQQLNSIRRNSTIIEPDCI